MLLAPSLLDIVYSSSYYDVGSRQVVVSNIVSQPDGGVFHGIKLFKISGAFEDLWKQNWRG
jgi:hypothetical protein